MSGTYIRPGYAKETPLECRASRLELHASGRTGYVLDEGSGTAIGSRFPLGECFRSVPNMKVELPESVFLESACEWVNLAAP